MKNILIIGAGKSSAALIKYLLDKSEKEDLQLTIGDIATTNAKKTHQQAHKCNGYCARCF